MTRHRDHLKEATRKVETAVAELEHVAKYPEHQRLSDCHDKSQVCGEFLDFLQSEKGLSLSMRYTCDEMGHDEDDCPCPDDHMGPAHQRIETLLAEFFDIDPKKLEDEKCAMLEECRRKNGG